VQNSLEDVFALLRFLRCGPYGVDASTAAQPSTTSTDLPETAPPSKKAHSLYTAEFVKGRGGGGGGGGDAATAAARREKLRLVLQPLMLRRCWAGVSQRPGQSGLPPRHDRTEVLALSECEQRRYDEVWRRTRQRRRAHGRRRPAGGAVSETDRPFSTDTPVAQLTKTPRAPRVSRRSGGCPHRSASAATAVQPPIAGQGR
jgi:hypothetical protein